MVRSMHRDQFPVPQRGVLRLVAAVACAATCGCLFACASPVVSGADGGAVRLVSRLGQGRIQAISFSSDGRWLVLCLASVGHPRVYVMDTRERSVRQVDLKREGLSAACAIAVDNHGNAVVGFREGVLAIVTDGKVRYVDGVGSMPLVACSASGRFAVVVVKASKVGLLVGKHTELPTNPVAELSANGGWFPTAVAISHTGATAAVVDGRGGVWLWQRGQLSRTEILPPGQYDGLLTNDRTLVAWTHDGVAYAWQFREPTQLYRCRLPEESGQGVLLAAAPDGWVHIIAARRLYGVSMDKWVAATDMPQLGKTLPCRSRFVLAASGTRNAARIAFFDPATRSLHVWSAADAENWNTRVETSLAGVIGVAVSPDEARLAFIAGGILWEGPLDASEPFTYYSSWPDKTTPASVCYTDSRHLVVATVQGTVVGLDPGSNKRMRVFQIPPLVRDSLREPGRSGTSNAPMAIAVLPHERVVVAASDGFLRVWNAQNGRLEHEWIASPGLETFRPSAVLGPAPAVVTCGLGLGYPVRYRVRTWSPTGRILEEWDLPDPVLAYTANADNGSVAVASLGPGFPVVVYSSHGDVLKRLNPHPDAPVAMAYLARGRYLAVGGTSGWLWVWNITSGRTVLRSYPHADAILTLTSGRKTLVAGSRDGTVSVWSVALQRAATN